MNKAQLKKVNSVLIKMSDLHPDHLVSCNPNLVINSLGGKNATFVFTPEDGTEEKFLTVDVDSTIKHMVFTMEEDLELHARLAERNK